MAPGRFAALRLSGGFLSLVLAVSCGGDSPSAPSSQPPPAPSVVIRVSGMPATFTRGQSVQLTATAESAAGTETVTGAASWQSSNASVASVSMGGVLTGVAAGDADITATYQGGSGSARATVRELPSGGPAFDVAVLVEMSDPRPARPEIDRVMIAATAKLLEKTAERMSVMEVTDVAVAPALTQVDAYVRSRSTRPEGVVVISGDRTAATFGGYSVTYAPPGLFQNEYPSPVASVGAGRIYVDVMDFDHMYARCGYDDNLNHISNVSIDGECRNRPGTPCVQVGDKWMCNNSLGDLYANHDYFTGCTVVHEFLHPFGSLGALDHYGTDPCRQRTGMSSQDAGDLRLFQQNCGMCPDVFNLFRRR